MRHNQISPVLAFLHAPLKSSFGKVFVHCSVLLAKKKDSTWSSLVDVNGSTEFVFKNILKLSLIQLSCSSSYERLAKNKIRRIQKETIQLRCISFSGINQDH
jgi:hypothetical protein